MSNPLISFLICYRTEEQSDNRCNLFMMLQAFKDFLKPTDYDKVEVLVRIDDDDIVAHDRLVRDNYQQQLPFTFKVFEHNKWEGRYAFNYHHMYLFSQRNPNSKFIGFMGDDCIHLPKCKDMIDEIEKKYLNKDYVILRSSDYDDTYPPKKPTDLKMKQRLEEITKMGDYRDLKVTQRWCTSFLVESYPIVSVKLLEVIGNLGWQLNIDSTLSLLNIMLYQKYGLNMYFMLDSKLYNRMDGTRKDKINPPAKIFNHEMTLHGSKASGNPYLYTLMEQQAKNIYLNMKEEGVLDEYKV